MYTPQPHALATASGELSFTLKRSLSKNNSEYFHVISISLHTSTFPRWCGLVAVEDTQVFSEDCADVVDGEWQLTHYLCHRVEILGLRQEQNRLGQHLRYLNRIITSRQGNKYYNYADYGLDFQQNQYMPSTFATMPSITPTKITWGH